MPRYLSVLILYSLSLDIEYAEPRTDSEQQMVIVWEEIFGVDGIGIDDDFFTLGGDSITGIRLVSSANKAGIPLETFHLFECYTIREIYDKYSKKLSIVVPEKPVVPIVKEIPWRERFSENIQE